MTNGQAVFLVVAMIFAAHVHFWCGRKFERRLLGKWNGQIAVRFVGESDDVYHHYGRSHANKIPHNTVIEAIVLCGAHAGSMPNIHHISLFSDRHHFLPYKVVSGRLGSVILFDQPIAASWDSFSCSLEIFIVGADNSDDDLGGHFDLRWEPAPKTAQV